MPILTLRRAVVAALLVASTAGAQPVRTPDADRADQAVTTFGPNGSVQGRAVLTVRNHLNWSDGVFRVESSGGGPCDLVLEDGGMLVVQNGWLEIRGDVRLRKGGTLQLIGTTCRLHNSYQREFNYYWEGGHLYTKDTTIGGWNDGAKLASTLRMDRGGLWTARQTVVQDTGGVLVGTFGDHLRDPALVGGTLDADGLYSGHGSEAVNMLRHGNASVRNSTMPITLNLGASQAASLDLDLDVDAPIAHRVYGDRNVHDALHDDPVTSHIPGAPWRLHLENTHVIYWVVSMFDVRDSGPAVDVTLHNARDVALRAMTYDLRGSPVLVGPWRTYYPAPRRLPGLPSWAAPGEHGIPPGCGVRIGNVTYRAPSNQWAYPQAWEFNFWGNADFAVRGSMRISEMFLDENARVLLEGDAEYNAGILAQTFDLHGDSSLTIRNATVGRTGSYEGAIIAYGRARCVLDNVRIKRVLLHTELGGWWPYAGVNEATISLSDFVEDEPVATRSARPGSITIDRAAPSEYTDLQNLDFEAQVSAGRPDYWSATGLNGYRSSTAFDNGAAFGYRTNASSGTLHKRLVIPPGTDVELAGWLQLSRMPPGATLRAFVGGSAASRRRSVTPALVSGQWVYFRTGPYTVDAADTFVEFGLEHSGAISQLDVRCDSFRVDVASWWDQDNLLNLDFDDRYVRKVANTEDGNTPNHWKAYNVLAHPESADVRPGAAFGSHATRIELAQPLSLLTLRKELSFLVPGQNVRFRGWVKPLASNTERLYVTVSELDSRWWDPSHGNNVNTSFLGSSWQPFDLSYVVPAPPLKQPVTALTISGAGGFLIDDCTVEVR